MATQEQGNCILTVTTPWSEIGGNGSLRRYATLPDHGETPQTAQDLGGSLQITRWLGKSGSRLIF